MEKINIAPKTESAKKYKPVPQPGEEMIDKEGVKWRWEDSGYTVRQWFSHSTEEKGPGPGWDMRIAYLLDDEWAMEHIGRTFNDEEVISRPFFLLPDVPYYRWNPVWDDEDEAGQ